ncbi:hypothetical protein L6R29_08545 [Myxococcota bacterium]|nr:hypothetical protein [Myxococcota bacterium]
MSSESPSPRRKYGTKHKGRARLLLSREDVVRSTQTDTPPESTHASFSPHGVSSHPSTTKQVGFFSEATQPYAPTTEPYTQTTQAYAQTTQAYGENSQSWGDSNRANEADTPSRKRLSTQIRNSLDGYPTYHEMRLWLELAQALEQQILQQERMLREQSARLGTANKPPSISSLTTEPSTFSPPLPTVPRRARQRIHTSPAQMALFQKKR